MSTPVVVSIGKATQDVFLQSSQDFAQFEHKGVQYESLPVGQKLSLDDVIFSTGGNATNAAVTFARQGLSSKYIWCLGDDITSEVVLQSLDKEGIDTTSVYQGSQYTTSYSAILMLSGGERTIFNHKGKMPEADSPDFDFSALDGADWVYLSSLGDMNLLERIVTYAVRQDTRIMFNPAGSELEESEKLKAILTDVDVLTLNKEEAQMIVEGGSLEELARRLRAFCSVVIVSDGPNGATATDGKTVVHAGMYEDVPVIDRTGGGDAFGSGFLSQYSQGVSLRDAIVFASANSTSVVQKIGAKEGILHQGVVLHGMPIEEKPY